MILLDTIPVIVPPTIDWGVELLKSFIVALPVLFVTITIWQLNVYTRRKREKHSIMANISPLIAKQANYFRNIERLEIQSQKVGVLIKTTNDEKLKDYWKNELSKLRSSIDTLQMNWLDSGTEAAILYNKLIGYISKEDSKKLGRMLRELGNINRRQFIEEFKNLNLPQAEIKAKELTKSVEKEHDATGVGKRVQDISKFLQNILGYNKRNPFKDYHCYYRCCCYIIEWFI